MGSNPDQSIIYAYIFLLCCHVYSEADPPYKESYPISGINTSIARMVEHSKLTQAITLPNHALEILGSNIGRNIAILVDVL
jgi:hypothetical protein